MYTSPSLQGEKISLVYVSQEKIFNHNYFEEFCDLLFALDTKPTCVFQIELRHPQAKFFIGSGKVEELHQSVQSHKIDLVIFSVSLSPAQTRNLEQGLQCRVLDKTGLILAIFAKRARTFEGKLQVELAQLDYWATRLVRGWTHLERQKGGIGLRGPGETQLELDRRMIRKRIGKIKERLEKVRMRRFQARASRKKGEIPTVSLVGYTNAGKSTLFNTLTHSSIYVADQLFATLDPTIHRFSLPNGKMVLLADTVGFIRDLPPDLIAAFRATLEETQEAHLLLHVIDMSHSEREEQREEVRSILKEIGAEEVPILEVYNKIDMLENVHPRVEYDEEGVPIKIWISAFQKQGIDLLKKAVSQRIFGKE